MLDGRKGLRSGCPCTLARWKALKAWRGGKHWQGRSQTPKAIRERERERGGGKSTKLFLLPSGRLCMWSSCRPGVEPLSYCIWNVHSNFQTSGQLVKGCQTAVTWLCVSYFIVWRVWQNLLSCVEHCFIYFPKVLCDVVLFYLVFGQMDLKCYCILCGWCIGYVCLTCCILCAPKTNLEQS